MANFILRKKLNLSREDIESLKVAAAMGLLAVIAMGFALSSSIMTL